ncbi:hypothetical protein ACH5RR_012684 [Cinchona calisaya]|uniref:Uncharacterized protein n=1 Tax=Cinchona calisaya TaxID=153742 RepID=A0ABD3A901_9GENT
MDSLPPLQMLKGSLSVSVALNANLVLCLQNMPNEQKQKKKVVQIQDDNLNSKSEEMYAEGSERHRNEDVDMNTTLGGFVKDAWRVGSRTRDVKTSSHQ